MLYCGPRSGDGIAPSIFNDGCQGEGMGIGGNVGDTSKIVHRFGVEAAVQEDCTSLRYMTRPSPLPIWRELSLRRGVLCFGGGGGGPRIIKRTVSAASTPSAENGLLSLHVFMAQHLGDEHLFASAAVEWGAGVGGLASQGSILGVGNNQDVPGMDIGDFGHADVLSAFGGGVQKRGGLFKKGPLKFGRWKKRGGVL